MDNVVEQAVGTAANEFAERLHSLTADPYFREAVVRMGVREAAWAIYHSFEDERTALSEQLTLMGDLIEQEEHGPPISY